MPLLYIPEAEIYTPQLNGDYTIYEYDDNDTLLKFGLWSDDLARIWLQEADFVLIEAQQYNGWLREVVEASSLQQLRSTPPVVSCRGDAQIMIFRRVD